MKYKIMQRFESSSIPNLWQIAGDTVTTNGVTTFTPYEYEDIEKLKEKVLELDAKFGHDNIMVTQDVELEFSVKVDGNSEDNTEDNNEDTTPTEPGDESNEGENQEETEPTP